MNAEKKLVLIYWLMLLGAVAWISVIFLAPLLKNQALPVSDMLYAVFSPLCHQIPSRCFRIFGHSLAVCTRCFGVYCGFLFGLCLYPLFKNLRSLSVPSKELLIVISLPIAVDAMGNLSAIWMTNDWTRFFIGAAWGVILPFYFAPGIFDMALNTGWQRRRIVSQRYNRGHA